VEIPMVIFQVEITRVDEDIIGTHIDVGGGAL
jgi:hypothetical protein